MIGITAKFLVCGFDKVLSGHGILADPDTGVITAVLPNAAVLAARPETLVRGEDSLLLPGFVNAHIHQYGILSHGIPVHVAFHDFQGFLEDYWWPCLEDRIGRPEALAASLASCAVLLRGGITSFLDTLEAPFAEDGTLTALAEQIEGVGMRAVVSLEASQRVDESNGQACLEQNLRAVRWCREHLKRVCGAVCTHTTFTCDQAFLRRAKELARQENALFQFHLSESIYEPSLCPEPAFVYERVDALDRDTLASQCVQMTQAELDLLARQGVRVVHMPLSNCEVGGGFAPVPAMLDRGICVGLGSDGYVDDFFEVMRGAFLLHKANLRSTRVMPAPVVFRMATEYGARCMGLEKVGRLEEGWQADCFLLRDRFLSPITEENLFDQVVVHGRREWITHTAAAGRLLLEDGCLTTIDEDAAYRAVRQITQTFWRALQ